MTRIMRTACRPLPNVVAAVTLAAAVVVFLLLLASPAVAADAPYQAAVSDAQMVYNQTGTQCAWAAMETMARRVGCEALSAATRTGRGREPYAAIEKALKDSGAAYESLGLREGPAGLPALYDFLERHVTRAGRPVAVGVGDGQHVLLVVHFERGRRIVTRDNMVGLPAGGLHEYGDIAAFEAAQRPCGRAFALTGPAVKTTHQTGPAVLDGKPLTLPLRPVQQFQPMQFRPRLVIGGS